MKSVKGSIVVILTCGWAATAAASSMDVSAFLPAALAAGGNEQAVHNVVLDGPEDRPLRSMTPVPNPVNRFDLSRIAVRNSSSRLDLKGRELAVLDGDLSTKTRLPAEEGISLDIHFMGHARFFNTIEVHTSARELRIDWLTPDGRWLPWLDSIDTSGGSASASGPEVRACGIRLAPLGEDAVEISELHGSFVQVDPDTARGQGDGKSYLQEWVENYSSSPLSNTSEDAWGLRNALPSDWSKTSYGNCNAWEEDFKRNSYGGTNSLYADAHDLVFFSGHGSTGSDPTYGGTSRSIMFSASIDDTQCSAGDTYACLGDSDLEWIGFSACQTMRDDSIWAAGMNGVHLMMGWQTNMWDTANFGKKFGKRMVDSGITDSPHTVKSSWFHAGEKTHGSGWTMEVIGENSTMGNDYLWGEGSVNSDPTVNNYYTRWSYDTRGRNDTTSEDKAPSFKDPVTFSGKAATVRIERALLDEQNEQIERGSGEIYKVLPRDVTAETVSELASKLCGVIELVCNGDVAPDDDMIEMIAASMNSELRVCLVDGSFSATDLGFWTREYTSPPNLIPGGEAADRTLVLLDQCGFALDDVLISRVHNLNQDRIEVSSSGEPIIVEEESFPITVQVEFNRMIPGSNLRLMGAGTAGQVSFGENGQVVDFSRGAWPNLTPSGSEPLVSIGEALERIAELGSVATINGLRIPLDQIDVMDVVLGYWTENCQDGQEYLYPVFGIDCLIIEPDGAKSMHTFIVPATNLIPKVTIYSEQNRCYKVGNDVCVQTSSNGAELARPIEVFADDGTFLGSGEQVCFNIWEPAGREGVRTVSIEARATDIHGYVVSDSVLLCTGLAADLNGDGTVAVQDLLALLEWWGQESEPWAGGDANGDGMADVTDLLVILEQWGESI